MKLRKVINLFGGPGAGKSVLAAGVFNGLSLMGVSCYLVPEVAKGLVLAGDTRGLEDQLSILARQHKLLRDAAEVYEYVIMDSPLLLSAVYMGRGGAQWLKGTVLRDSLTSLVLNLHLNYPSLDFWVKRSISYTETGRLESWGQAMNLDEQILANWQGWCREHPREVWSGATGVAQVIVAVRDDMALHGHAIPPLPREVRYPETGFGRNQETDGGEAA